MEKILKIEGMMCNHCVMHVQKALAAVSNPTEPSSVLLFWPLILRSGSMGNGSAGSSLPMYPMN